MRPALRSLLLLLAACHPTPGVPPSADSLAVAALVRERLAAGLVGDTAAWHRHVADGALWTGPGLQPVLTPQVLPVIAANLVLTPGAQSIEGLAVHFVGPVAQATYVQLVAGPTGGPRDGKRFRKTDTYLRTADGWQLVGAAEIAVPYRPVAMLSADRIGALAGSFVLTGVDSLSLTGEPSGRFQLRAADGSVTELLPADDSTLFEEGDPGDWIVRLGRAGSAGALVYRMQGSRDIVLPRVGP